jgi:hypothetical protein
MLTPIEGFLQLVVNSSLQSSGLLGHRGLTTTKRYAHQPMVNLATLPLVENEHNW